MQARLFYNIDHQIRAKLPKRIKTLDLIFKYFSYKRIAVHPEQRALIVNFGRLF